MWRSFLAPNPPAVMLQGSKAVSCPQALILTIGLGSDAFDELSSDSYRASSSLRLVGNHQDPSQVPNIIFPSCLPHLSKCTPACKGDRLKGHCFGAAGINQPAWPHRPAPARISFWVVLESPRFVFKMLLCCNKILQGRGSLLVVTSYIFIPVFHEGLRLAKESLSLFTAFSQQPCKVGQEKAKGPR